MNAPVAISAMASKVPPAPVLAVLSRYRREDIESFVAIAIDLLDLADGDPDAEIDDHPEEDDPHGQCDEDGINTAFSTVAATSDGGAGCILSDPGGCEHDGREPDEGN